MTPNGQKLQPALRYISENISEGLISESKAEEGCKTFVQVSKAESKDVVMRNNNTAIAADSVSIYK